MALELLAVVVVTFIAAYLISRDEERTDQILMTRQVLFGLIGFAGAIILIGTGSFGLVVLGASILFLIWLKVFKEEPYEGVIS